MTYNKYKQNNDKCQVILDNIKNQSKVNPQKDQGHFTLRLEIHIVEALVHVDYKYSKTLPVLMIILRRTWGFMKNQKSWTIKFSDIMKHLPPNSNDRSVRFAISEAKERNILLVVEERGKPTTYCFNKHYDTWIYDKEMQGTYAYTSVNNVKVNATKEIHDRGETGFSSNTGNTTEAKGWVDVEYVFNRWQLIELHKYYNDDDLDIEKLWLNSKGIPQEKAFGTLLNKNGHHPTK
jgi:hypothetical protein